MIRSGLSPSNTAPRPPFSPPIRRSASTSTSSKKSCHCWSGPMCGIGIWVLVKPGASTSMIASDGRPERAVGVAEARHHQHRVGLLDARDVGLLPVEEVACRRPCLHVSSTRLCELVPASGSVIAKAILVVPAPIPRSQRSFCSGVPCLVRMLPTIAGETTISSSEQPAAAISSPTAASASMPEAAAAVLLGDVHAEVAAARERVPQLGRRARRRRSCRACTSARSRSRCRRRLRGGALPPGSGRGGGWRDPPRLWPWPGSYAATWASRSPAGTGLPTWKPCAKSTPKLSTRSSVGASATNSAMVCLPRPAAI